MEQSIELEVHGLTPFTALGSHGVTRGFWLGERAVSNGEERLGQRVSDFAIRVNFRFGDEVF